MLVGHSAGAHLSALAILFLIDCRDELFVEAGMQRNIAKAIKGLIGESCGTRSNVSEDRVVLKWNNPPAMGVTADTVFHCMIHFARLLLCTHCVCVFAWPSL